MARFVAAIALPVLTLASCAVIWALAAGVTMLARRLING
jgi:hypothetical protein